eukprot:TRINITY_DN7791_c0_g1_i1.p1 TRINITY_DN7791_c0_g1~~TRINITY_DN7791_c0_g1_i1.p1  ORF type:complete len:655 (+),score=131.26 TRINITY_DN7791_c0_g1_i1:50-2014(+)
MTVPLSADQVRQLAVTMNCMECNELPTDPVVLPCGDLFCFDCSFEYVDSMRGRKCPKCGIPCMPPQLRRCPQLVEIIENLRQLMQLVTAAESYKKGMTQATQRRQVNLPPPSPARSPSRSPTAVTSLGEVQDLTTPEIIRAVAVDTMQSVTIPPRMCGSFTTSEVVPLTSTTVSNPTSELVGFQGIQDKAVANESYPQQESQESEGSTQSEHIPIIDIGMNLSTSKAPDTGSGNVHTNNTNTNTIITQSLQPNSVDNSDAVSQFSDKTEITSPTHFRIKRDQSNWQYINDTLRSSDYNNVVDMSLELLLERIPNSRLESLKNMTNEIQEIDSKLEAHKAAFFSNGLSLDIQSPQIIKIMSEITTPKPTKEVERANGVSGWSIQKRKTYEGEGFPVDGFVKRAKNRQETTSISPARSDSSDKVMNQHLPPQHDTSPDRSTTTCITTSGLSRSARDEVEELCHKKGIPYTDSFQEGKEVTHLVTIDPSPRTLKYCLAVVKGVWIVDRSWLLSEIPTDQKESDFEVKGDTGCQRSFSPAIGRAARMVLSRNPDQRYFTYSDNRYPTSLLFGYTVTLANDFTVVSTNELIELCRCAGASTIFVGGQDPLPSRPPSKHLIICDNRSGCSKAGKLYNPSGSGTVLPVRGLLSCICRWSFG